VLLSTTVQKLGLHSVSMLGGNLPSPICIRTSSEFRS